MLPLIKAINITSRCSTLYYSEKMEPFGITGIQHSYISNICRNPGISQESLARMIYVNKSNVARQLAHLENTGFITRSPSENDKREILVFPTEKAQKIYDDIHRILGEWNEYLMDGLTDPERESLTSAMQKMADRASEWARGRSL